MNTTKLFTLFASLLATFILVSSFASAYTLEFTNPAQLMRGTNSTQVTLSTNSAIDVSISPLQFTPSAIISSQGASVTFGVSPSAGFSINNAASRQITLFVQSLIGQLPFGVYTTTLNATGNNGTTQVSTIIPVSYVQSFCQAGARETNLSIEKVDISSSGDDDEDWRLLDRVDVEVKVENNGDNDIDDVQVEMGLFDSEGRNVVNDLDFSNSDEEQIDLGNLNDGDDETVNFQFTVPADFDTNSYKLTVKVYSDDLGESNMCDDTSNEMSDTTFQTITVDNEDEEEKFIVVDYINMPSETTCSETVTGTFKVFNIGDEDQDQVLITMKNAELNLNREFEIRENLDKGDDDTLDFAFEVPAGARDGTYAIVFKTFYDYDDNDNTYDQESEDDFIATLKVIGCSNVPPSEESNVAITAELGSDAVAGAPFEITVTLRNEGNEEAAISLDAEGYESWGDLSSISRESFTLAAGEEREVTFSLEVNDDVTGTESFVVLATINGKRESQEVEIDFGGSDTGKAGFSLPQGSGLLWIIGIINVVLIVLIIIVAVRLSRR